MSRPPVQCGWAVWVGSVGLSGSEGQSSQRENVVGGLCWQEGEAGGSVGAHGRAETQGPRSPAPTPFPVRLEPLPQHSGSQTARGMWGRLGEDRP